MDCVPFCVHVRQEVSCGLVGWLLGIQLLHDSQLQDCAEVLMDNLSSALIGWTLLCFLVNTFPEKNEFRRIMCDHGGSYAVGA